MLFRPGLDTILTIDNTRYAFLEHPNAKRMVYGQTGKRGTVYQIKDQAGQLFAFKVFTQKYRSEDIETSCRLLLPYQNVLGLEVCQRLVFTTHSHNALIKQYPDLEYAVQMPWVQGETWFDVIKSRPTLTKDESRFYSKAFTAMMANIEQRGLAHCDLSGPNLLIDFNVKRVALVDIEEMYGPDFIRPSILPSGTPGYGHKTAGNGLWGPYADRFSGSVLIAEILGKCDPHFQEEMAGEAESFFEKDEIQTTSPRYQALSKILLNNYGQKIQALFEQAWFSSTLDACPRLAEWNSALEETPEARFAAAVPTVPAANIPRLYKTDNEVPGAAMDILASRETVSATSPAAASKPAVQPPPVLKDGPVSAWRSLRPERVPDPGDYQAPGAQQVSQMYFSSHPATGSAVPTTSTQSVAALQAAALQQTTTAVKPFSAKLPFNIIWGFALVGILSVAALLVFGSSVESIKAFTQNISFIAFYSFGSTGLALLLGLLQAWVFKGRLHIAKRLMYILITALGGLAGGVVAGIVTTIVFTNYFMYLMGFAAGAIIGAVGGIVASLGQNIFLGNASAAGKWFLFNFISWTATWSLGWGMGALIIGPIGTALGAGLMLLLAGVALQWMLKKTPEIEF